MDHLIKKLEHLWELDHKFLKESSNFKNFHYLPFSEEDIKTFENGHKFELPIAYRDFLLHISNGGIGPGNGIFPLNIKKEFPKLNLPWIDPLEYNELFLFDPTKDSYDTYNDTINNARLKDSTKVDKLIQGADNGQLPIADDGCGMYYFLVVKGKHTGEIWLNRMANEGGFKWVANSFGEWFEDWLDEAILESYNNNQAIKELYADEGIQFFLPENVKDLEAFVDRFSNLSDKRPVKELLKRVLEQSTSQQVIAKSIDYLLNDDNYNKDHNDSLQLLFQLENLDESNKKKNLCQQGKALFDLGKQEEALIYFDKALFLSDPIYTNGELEEPYLSLMCYCLLKSNELDKVLDYMEDADQAVLFLQDIYHTIKDHAMASVWGEIVIDHPKFKEDEELEDYLQDIYLILIYANASIKNEPKAHLYLNKLMAFKVNPNNIPFENIVDELIAIKNYHLALTYLEKYQSLNRSKQNMEWFHYRKGQCLMGQENFLEAHSHFHKSYQLKHWILPCFELIKINKKLGNLEETKKLIGEIPIMNKVFLKKYQFISDLK